MSPARTVLVAGGGGALGRAVVQAFLVAGDRVVVPWIVPREEQALAAEHAGAVGEDRLRLVRADVAEAGGARAAVEAAGTADVLVNGVGGFAGGTPVAETELEVWDRMYRINLRSAAALCRASLPAMLARGRGCIIQVASQAGLDPPAGLAAYAAAKAGVAALTRALQREVETQGVRVNALVPGTIDTPANRQAMPDADFSRWTPPERIAAVVLWLASDDAAAVRGGLIPV